MIDSNRLPVLTLFLLLAMSFAEAKTSVTKQAFGKLPSGAAVDLYTRRWALSGARDDLWCGARVVPGS